MGLCLALPHRAFHVLGSENSLALSKSMYLHHEFLPYRVVISTYFVGLSSCKVVSTAALGV